MCRQIEVGSFSQNGTETRLKRVGATWSIMDDVCVRCSVLTNDDYNGCRCALRGKSVPVLRCERRNTMRATADVHAARGRCAARIRTGPERNTRGVIYSFVPLIFETRVKHKEKKKNKKKN